MAASDDLEPVSDLEREGIPDLESAYPGETATGVRWDEIVPPGDAPAAVEDFGVTAAEEVADEPLAVRVAREQPEVGAGVVADPDDADTVVRLLAPAGGTIDVDDEGELLAGDVDDAALVSPEESALSVVSEDDAPGVTWDASPDYVGDEAPGGGAGEAPPG